MQRLGGYRIVRKIGEGSRAEIMLAHPDRAEGDGAPVAIKVFRESVDSASISREAEALARAAGEHVVEVIDAMPGPRDAPALVLRRLGGGLARVLRDRDALRVGEAITILAPIVTALSRAHASGVAHGSLGTGAVLFDAAGAPVLASFGRAELFEPALPLALLDELPAVRRDLADAAALARLVLQRVPTGAAHDLAATLPAEPRAGWLEELAPRLFELGQALPLRVGSVDPPEIPGQSRLIVPTSGAVEQQVSIERPRWLPSVLPEPVVETIDRVLAMRQPLTRSLARVRRPVWIAAAAGALALVVAVALSGVGDDAEPEAELASATPSPVAVHGGPVVDDDPVAAALALLEARERCIRDLSVLCLDAVAQPGSAALESDRRLVRELQAGGEYPDGITTEGMVLVERLGDSALVALGPDSEPASLLLMKGEAGWRIRDYLTG